MTFSAPLTLRLHTLDCCLRRARSASRSKPSPRAVPGRGRSAEAVDESETGSANFFGPAHVVGLLFLDPFSHCTIGWRNVGKGKGRNLRAAGLFDPLTLSANTL